VVSTCLSIIIESYSLLIPLYGTERGLSATAIGLMLSTMSFAMLGIRAAAPLLARRVPHRRLLVFALFQASIAYAIYPLVDSMALHLALAVLIGSAVGLTQPMTMVMLYELAPRGRDGEAIGLRQLFVSSGQVGVPLAFGALAGAAGLLPAFWIIAALGFGGGIYGRHAPGKGEK
jgi:MFS family permease